MDGSSRVVMMLEADSGAQAAPSNALQLVVAALAPENAGTAWVARALIPIVGVRV